jgi:hypothetical protein
MRNLARPGSRGVPRPLPTLIDPESAKSPRNMMFSRSGCIGQHDREASGATESVRLFRPRSTITRRTFSDDVIRSYVIAGTHRLTGTMSRA